MGEQLAQDIISIPTAKLYRYRTKIMHMEDMMLIQTLWRILISLKSINQSELVQIIDPWE